MNILFKGIEIYGTRIKDLSKIFKYSFAFLEMHKHGLASILLRTGSINLLESITRSWNEFINLRCLVTLHKFEIIFEITAWSETTQKIIQL